MPIQVDIRQLVKVIASAVDLVGVDDVFHGRRVGVMAVECAKYLGWDQEQLALLFDAGLLHDCGVSSTRVHRTLVNELDWSEAFIHCDKGGKLLNSFAPLSHLAPIIIYHHSHWDELVKRDLDPTTALMANLIYMIDRVDVCAAKYYGDNSLLLHMDEIRDLVMRHRGIFFAPQLVDVFLEASRAEAFWLLLNAEFIALYSAQMEQFSQKLQIGITQLKQFALIVAEIVDAKSHFTTDHSFGVARLTRFLAMNAGFEGNHLDILEIAALLHDIGKLQVPDEILESTAELSPVERVLMKKHSFTTFQILKHISCIDELANWASQHHESLNGNGYPFRLQATDISLEARIIKVADVFQALAQNRPYRSSMPAADILVLMRKMQMNNELDGAMVNYVAQHLDECHVMAVGR